MPTTDRMADMAWPDYAARIEAGAAVIVPVGAIEQHGHHLPLGVDLAAAVAEDAARDLDAVVAEPIAYGARSQMRMGGGETFPGTTSLRADTAERIQEKWSRFSARNARQDQKLGRGP